MSKTTAQSRRDKRWNRENRVRVKVEQRKRLKEPPIDITDDLARHLPTYMSPVTIQDAYQARLREQSYAKRMLNRLFGAFGAYRSKP
jgi:hypothetical protein